MAGQENSNEQKRPTDNKEVFTKRVQEPQYYKEADGTLKELIYIQDLMKKTEIMSRNTLLAELKVSIRFFEQNYIDHSVHIEHTTLFGSKLSENFTLDHELAQIAFTR